MSVTTLPDLNLLPAEALKELVLAQHEQLLWRESEIEHLKLPEVADRQTAAHAVWTEVGEAGAAD
jgi:hypothetical protein